jgi:hypothetical protein
LPNHVIRHGRPSASLLDLALSERAGGPNVIYKSIAISPSTSTSSLFSITTSSRSTRDPRPCLGLYPQTPLLVTLVAISRPCLGRAFYTSAVSKSPLPIHSFNRGSHPFSSFGNLILAQANVSSQLVSALPIHPLLGNYM